MTGTAARGAVLLLAAAATLAGCGGGGTSATPYGSSAANPSVTGSATSAESAPPGEGASREVVVSETDFALALPSSIKAGPTTFTVRNDGEAPHDLAVKGPGVDEVSRVVRPGQSVPLQVTLQRGTYTLWCTVGTHRAQGMEATLEVS